MAPDIEACPRGSYMSMVRRSSALYRNHWRRWNMVWPGRTPTPPVMTRVGIPSVCESTPCRTRLERMRSTETVVDGLLGDVPDGLFLFGQQRLTRRPAPTAVAPDHVLRELDGLHELGLGVPTQQRVHGPVQRQGGFVDDGNGRLDLHKCGE